MTILRSELRQYHRSLIAWSGGFAVAILFLYPVFAAIISGDVGDRVELESMLAGNPTTQALGIDPQDFFTPLGIYGLLHAVLLLPAAAQAAGLGLSIITKENMQNTADFLLTKPFSRPSVYLSKAAAGVIAILITSAAFLLASLVALILQFGTDFPVGSFLLLFLVFPLIQLFFLVLGMAVGTLISRIGAPLPLALGIAFVIYTIGMFSSVVQSVVARAFSPFKYFPSSELISGQGYDSVFLTLYLGWIAVLGVLGVVVFVRKDVPTAR